jgi:hypothetical protein
VGGASRPLPEKPRLGSLTLRGGFRELVEDLLAIRIAQARRGLFQQLAECSDLVRGCRTPDVVVAGQGVRVRQLLAPGTQKREEGQAGVRPA